MIPVLRQHEYGPSARRRLGRRVLAAAVAFAAAAMAACAQAAPASQDDTPADGRQLFARACAKCHSADGTGGLPRAAGGPRPIDLRDPEWQRSRPDDAIVATIRDGRGAMPPFAGVLTPQEINAVARHVRALARP
jgi:mono/diheme cytochrome c family protein